ncbi:UDP-GlcNAc:betaGal beta-1,3-N-acetylglucosaminyltransferase 9 [Scyliorhinus canicula]|uniref:UDP-GlcNAc:betaGal beta-1,3-N-acetylglucosaminyltransferase 9 n=1 Tax=Scyliorhinus canicula TaxID=7830 RepID=UPI0018F686A4|nr:UDP-GlcNAc:betaGal beta-1,3-N-acetylglucosaminyltransferase 9 [Scyliorhinus canicula]XP_038662870.1 UDP-GlcNAc:betaGal beta-1,3-N-acetylglucosaminyltransferase 9 [Scyliorhinus canicula]
MRLRRKGDLICTFLLLTAFCILLYVQMYFESPQLNKHVNQRESGTERSIMESTKAKSQLDVTISATKLERNCQPGQELENAQVKTSPIPNLLPWNYRQYLWQKDCREFNQIINQKEKCRKIQGEQLLLISIKSMVEEFERREVARKTWAQEGRVHNLQVRRLFLLGVPANQSSVASWSRLLEHESQMYQDILLWDFQDTFFNLTLKEIHFLKWFDQFCPDAEFVFKGDDDVFVNVENIADFLADTDPKDDLFVGHIIYQALPIRSNKSKYYIPEMMYGQGIYPLYAGGGGFLMSGHTAKRLYHASKEVDLFPIDDVFLGMCLLRIGLEPLTHEGFRTFGIVRPSAAPHMQMFDPCFYKELMVVHSLKVPEIWLMWSLLHDPKLNCARKGSMKRPFRWRVKRKTTPASIKKRRH